MSEYSMCDDASPCDECGNPRLVVVSSHLWGGDDYNRARRVSKTMKVVCYNTDCIFEGMAPGDGDRIRETTTLKHTPWRHMGASE